LERTIKKKKKLILCGDWNVNLMPDSVKLQELKHLLLMYNLINTDNIPNYDNK